MSDSYKVYASEEYVDKKVPSPDGTHQMLVTDADGSTKWEDRTHYEENIKIAWDGNIAGRETTEFRGMTYVNISDKVLTAKEMIGMSVHVAGWSASFGPTLGLPDTFIVSADMITESDGRIMVIYAEEVSNVPTVVVVPDQGMYVWYVPAGSLGEMPIPEPIYADSMEISTVHSLDPKYLPPLVDANGGKWRLVVSTDGTLSTEAVTE